ncbi:MAG: hypothetical protein RR224_08005 [Clostridia bacterium]
MSRILLRKRLGQSAAVHFALVLSTGGWMGKRAHACKKQGDVMTASTDLRESKRVHAYKKQGHTPTLSSTPRAKTVPKPVIRQTCAHMQRNKQDPA